MNESFMKTCFLFLFLLGSALFSAAQTTVVKEPGNSNLVTSTTFQIEDLDVDSYSAFFKTLDETNRAKVLFVCIPAKLLVIGEAGDRSPDLSSYLSQHFKVIRPLDNYSQGMAEKSCAQFRQPE